jgi:hypothetical protein
MKKYGLSMCTQTRIAQKMLAEYKMKILQSQELVTAYRKSCLEFGQIGNMDKVPLTFHVPLNKSVVSEGAKLTIIKTYTHEKMHYTAVLTCCADSIKLPLLLIFKRKQSSVIIFHKEFLSPFMPQDGRTKIA